MVVNVDVFVVPLVVYRRKESVTPGPRRPGVTDSVCSVFQGAFLTPSGPKRVPKGDLKSHKSASKPHPDTASEKDVEKVAKQTSLNPRK